MKSLLLLLLILIGFGESYALTLPKDRATLPYDCANCDQLPHETLSMSWPIPISPLHQTTLHQQTSRKYQITASLKQLRRGVSIYTQAPGAIIRISPVNKLLFNPDFRIRNNHGFNASLMDASSLFSKDEALNNTPFASNTFALAELKPEIGSGQFILSSSAAVNTADDSLFIIHVFDKNSSTELNVQTNKARYYQGDEFIATITLNSADLDYPIDKLIVSLISPEGQITSLNATALAPNLYQVKTILDSEKNSQGANWYIAAAITSIFSDQIVKRQAHSAFSYIIPSASVEKLTSDNTDLFRFAAEIQVATASRYELQAVLFASDNQGEIHPIQTAQSSAWLSPGQQILKFSFDSNRKTDYKAPYYLGYIHLTDFGQMKPVFEYNKPIELTQIK